jgi:hypothetical protein
MLTVAETVVVDERAMKKAQAEHLAAAHASR